MPTWLRGMGDFTCRFSVRGGYMKRAFVRGDSPMEYQFFTGWTGLDLFSAPYRIIEIGVPCR